MEFEKIEATHFRQVMGRYPTGVAVVTGLDGDGCPVGLAVGSFTSVSLDPPLVAFMPDRRSTSWPRIMASGRFCVNILSEAQENTCRIFASKSPDKFAQSEWYPSELGSPILNEAVAWVDCVVEAIHPAGDHDIVIGRVHGMEQANNEGPLLFYRGGYGRFTSATLVARDVDLMGQLAVADKARPKLEELARNFGCEATILSLFSSDVLLLASAGPSLTSSAPTWVGQRIPAIPPMGAAMMAWQPEEVVSKWLAGSDGSVTDPVRRQLDDIRKRGYSVILDGPAALQLHELVQSRSLPTTESLTEEQIAFFNGVEMDPPGFSSDDSGRVTRVYVPLFDADGHSQMLIGLHFQQPVMDGMKFDEKVRELLRAAVSITLATGGRHPKAEKDALVTQPI